MKPLELFFRLHALIRKELLLVLKDPSSRVILFLPVLLQSLLFGYVATYDLSNVPYAVLDQSRSPTSTRLLARLDGTGFFRRVATLESSTEIAPTIDLQKALMVVQIGPRFEQDLLAGRSAAVQLILDARNSTTANTAAADVAAVVDDFNASELRRRGGPGPALTLETRAWFNPNLETRWNFMPALIATLSMLQTLLLTALSVAREREQGTFDQLLVTPLSPTEIMIGKAIPPMLIGLVQSTLVMLVTRFWFHIPMAGSLLTLYVGLAAFIFAGVGIGLSISALSATMQQAELYTFVLLLPMMLLSGLTTPVASMPRALQIATLANPVRFGIDLVRRVYLEGVGLGTVFSDIWPMLLIAAVTLPTAAWLFRNRLT
ncbi:MAG: ABC transporter permease [Burkholderiales bacterium]|nr:ABC transporter permease [Burkholderiales bacterium]MDE2395153.1 ABC transporter permease [Burkholderiales bacterium]